MKTTPSNMPEAAEFSRRVALVTGGTSGLGRHLVHTLCGMGEDVFFCGRREAPGRELEDLLGGKGHFVACDVSDAGQADTFVRAAGEFKGRIDHVVNNVADDRRIAFESATADDFDRAMSVNLRSYFTVARAALPYLKAGAGKAIVNIGTTNYMLGLSTFTVYNAAKSGIVGFTRSLARELGPVGIRVNMVSPGWIMTAKQLREHVGPGDREALLDAQCLKFLLTEEYVTPATLFLLSAAAAGITGQELVVDGGKVMH
jgi:NAD(P)-dependent dehydrogenase (short-subunit alcohol dehydrogenase family)